MRAAGTQRRAPVEVCPRAGTNSCVYLGNARAAGRQEGFSCLFRVVAAFSSFASALGRGAGFSRARVVLAVFPRVSLSATPARTCSHHAHDRAMVVAGASGSKENRNMPSCRQTFLSVVKDRPSTSAASFCTPRDKQKRNDGKRMCAAVNSS